VRRKLASVDDGDRQMVDILTAVLTDGLPADAPESATTNSWPPTYRDAVIIKQCPTRPTSALRQVSYTARSSTVG
jgi:hypothetical protein